MPDTPETKRTQRGALQTCACVDIVRIALNHAEVTPEPDGSVRLVLAHRDPGHPNWLETAGHRRGTMCLRWVGAKVHPDPATRVVKGTG